MRGATITLISCCQFLGSHLEVGRQEEGDGTGPVVGRHRTVERPRMIGAGTATVMPAPGSGCRSIGRQETPTDITMSWCSVGGVSV